MVSRSEFLERIVGHPQAPAARPAGTLFHPHRDRPPFVDGRLAGIRCCDELRGDEEYEDLYAFHGCLRGLPEDVCDSAGGCTVRSPMEARMAARTASGRSVGAAAHEPGPASRKDRSGRPSRHWEDLSDQDLARLSRDLLSPRH
jgi:hypothetical protein